MKQYLKRQSNEKFQENYTKGIFAETFVLGWLKGEYKTKDGYKVLHVSQYSPGRYRTDDGITKLPDCAITKNGKIYKFIEVKLKEGRNNGEYLNLNSKDVKNYTDYADTYNADFQIIFICPPKKAIYSLPMERLRVSPDSSFFDNNGARVCLYDTDLLDVLEEDIPLKVFQNTLDI